MEVIEKKITEVEQQREQLEARLETVRVEYEDELVRGCMGEKNNAKKLSDELLELEQELVKIGKLFPGLEKRLQVAEQAEVERQRQEAAELAAEIKAELQKKLIPAAEKSLLGLLKALENLEAGQVEYKRLMLKSGQGSVHTMAPGISRAVLRQYSLFLNKNPNARRMLLGSYL